MADTSGLPPEGWYPDRPNATRLRHWTGTQWTNEFRPLVPAAAAPQQPVRETTDARTRRELRAQVGALVQGEPDTPSRGTAAVPVQAPAAQPAPVRPAALRPAVQAPAPTISITPEPEPAVAAAPEPDPSLSHADRARVAGGYTPARTGQPWQDSFPERGGPTGSAQTFSGWLFATSPLWTAALLIAGMTVLSIVNPFLVQGGLLVVSFAMTFLLARQDVRHLVDRGYRAPSLWWVLLPFFYLVVRMVKVGVRGAGLVVTYILAFVALVGLLWVTLVGNPALLASITPPGQAQSTPIPEPVATLSSQERNNLLTKDGMEAQVRLDLAKTFDVGPVECVPFASMEVGTTTTCVVELDGVAYNAGLQLTPDQPSTAFVFTGMTPVEN